MNDAEGFLERFQSDKGLKSVISVQKGHLLFLPQWYSQALYG